MKKLFPSIFILFAVFSSNTSAQLKRENIELDTSKSFVYSSSEYFDVNKRFMFEIGLLFNLTGRGIKSTYAGTFNFNLIAKRLYGSLQLGLCVNHGDERGAFALFGLGLDNSVFTLGVYNLSIYFGVQGITAPPHFYGDGWWALHLRNNIFLDDNTALSIGLRYLPRMGVNGHWLMPTLGYQLLLK